MAVCRLRGGGEAGTVRCLAPSLPLSLPMTPPPPGHADRIILVLGAPRSGTTWLGKIFDSHPDVLYRHEPDIIDRGGMLPKVVAPADIAAWTAPAREYLLRLAALSRLKTAGQLPLFRKTWRGAMAQGVQSGVIHLLRLLEQVPGGAALAERLAVPDLAARPPGRVVIKSVSGCGCAGLFAAALPRAHIVFLLRPPFAQIASMLTGSDLRKLDAAQAVLGLWDWPVATQYGLTKAGLVGLPLAERLAWLWVVLNETALADLAGRPGVRVLDYRALRARPEQEARALFGFAGLDWSAQTAAFLVSSTQAGGREGYYAVRRNTAEPDRKWRNVLSAADCTAIAAIVQQSTLVRFLDTRAAA